MINKEQAVNIFQRFAAAKLVNESWYREIKPYIKAILLYGSVAKGTNRPDSDIDILFVLPLSVEEEYTSGEYSYVHKGHEINIVLRSIEKLRNIAHERNDLFQKEVFRNSLIITASDEEVAGLLKQIAGM